MYPLWKCQYLTVISKTVNSTRCYILPWWEWWWCLIDGSLLCCNRELVEFQKSAADVVRQKPLSTAGGVKRLLGRACTRSMSLTVFWRRVVSWCLLFFVVTECLILTESTIVFRLLLLTVMTDINKTLKMLTVPGTDYRTSVSCKFEKVMSPP